MPTILQKSKWWARFALPTLRAVHRIWCSPDERSDIRDLHSRSPHIAVLMRATCLLKPGRRRRLADLVNPVRVEGNVILDLRHRIKWGLVNPHRLRRRDASCSEAATLTSVSETVALFI